MRERSKSLEGRLLEVGLEEGFRVTSCRSWQLKDTETRKRFPELRTGRREAETRRERGMEGGERGKGRAGEKKENTSLGAEWRCHGRHLRRRFG
ncbi:hypothetical protein B296_00043993 [Ensete ventricosum]|uniref:Uncharacterized protein n=1 Tax=Ensete ventricosum TaxID=4639 RepID=A0A426ZCH1_ENSVE|nr:hypothetical protein B296_00043993 [Ensete ventricosum]